MMNYFLAVNYGTSDLIEKWVYNIRSVSENSKIILVDNFKNKTETEFVKKIAEKLDIELILSENIGYGKGLNKAIEYCFNDTNNDFNIFAGNLDIEYLSFSSVLPKGKYIYIPVIKELGKENRNPFLTRIQKIIIPLYYMAGYFKSTTLLNFSILINKFFSIVPSEIWAVHGSLFCFHSSCMNKSQPIFNENSFLYCEEMEFASYMESKNIKFINVDIQIKHYAHVATKDITSSKKEFLNLWWPSYKNWYTRWK